MRLLRPILVLLSCLPGTARAEPLLLTGSSPGTQCRAAIAVAERAAAIPPQLMAAIGRVESGRRDPVSGTVVPWPWTINAEGQGSFYDTKEQAIAAVRALQSHGVQSIDVGCMQVNLMHHPDAFANLEQALDPSANTAYAARFLNQLHAQTSDWARAAGQYHSSTPGVGEAYQAKVASAWTEERSLASGTLPMAGASPTMAAALSPAALSPAALSPIVGGGFRGGLPATMPRAGPQVGRDLAAYRAMPILLAARAPMALRQD
jgi:hypothetical protein